MHIFKPGQQEKINQKFKKKLLVDPKQTVGVFNFKINKSVNVCFLRIFGNKYRVVN